MAGQKKQFLALLLVVVIGAAAFFGLRAWQESKDEAREAEKEAETITAASLTTDQITAFSYRLDGEELSFEKMDGVWHYSGDADISINQTMIDTMLQSLSKVTAARQIPKPENTDEYGFADPSNVIRVQVGQEEITFTLGMYNTVTSQYYLMVSGDENVYLVEGQITTAFGKTLEEVTEKTEE